MRLHLFEFEDYQWFPDAIRQGGTDYLRYFLNVSGFYKPVIPIIAEALEKSGKHQILDLCSGGGGAIETIQEDLATYIGRPVNITLSDKFPNLNAYRHIAAQSGGSIGYKEFSVDATAVPPDIGGLRTMFSATHHFPPETIKKIVRDSVEANALIALFDGGDKNPLVILGIILFHPVAFLLCTPFFRPFRWSRLLFTYLVPLIPLTTIWDGAVSILRLYKPSELLAITKETDNKEEYEWKAGRVKNKLGMRVAYLSGIPKKK